MSPGPLHKVLFVAGDLSGDQIAARTAAVLREGGTEILALGGPALREVADVWLGDLVSHGAMGFWEPVKKIPAFWRVLRRVIEPALAAHRPAVVVPVDFFGFNRHTARAARRAGARVCYFVSPQVWASRPGRIRALKSLVDRMLVIFPFEEELYRRHGVPVTFVGHPLLDVVPAGADPAPAEPILGLLPGSRPAEVRRHLPLFLAAADRLATGRPGFRCLVFAAPSLRDGAYERFLAGRPYPLELVRDEGYRRRRSVAVALACSGTATLENALLEIPTAAAYRTSWPTYALARALVRVDRIAMPNILVGRDVMPEFIQARAAPEGLAGAAAEMLDHPERRAEARRALREVRSLLGGPGASRRAAAAIRAEAA